MANGRTMLLKPAPESIFGSLAMPRSSHNIPGPTALTHGTLTSNGTI